MGEVIDINSIGNRIKQLRVNAHMTQEEMAIKLNVTRQAISNWETGKTQPDIETLHQIAIILETDINKIIYGEKQYMQATHIKSITNKTVKSGITFGTCLAMVISYVTWQSIPWAIFHGILGWFYVIYYLLKYSIS